MKLLPYLLPNEHGDAGFDCARCLDPEANQHMPPEVREGLHCGWDRGWEKSGRAYEGPPQIASVDLAALGVCPGYLTRAPLVVEITRAYAALKQNAIETYYPDAPRVVLEGAMEMVSAFNAFEAEELRKSRDKAHG